MEIERRQDAMVALLQDLVRQPSMLGQERGAQEVISSKWQSLGLQSEMWQPRVEALAAHPAFAPVEWGYEGRPNVTAILKSPVGDGRSLILNGHMDVVSPEPVSLWTHDPWAAEIEDGRMYGRGAADMKSGIAMMALALEALQASGVKLRGDVTVETVIEEEASGNGTLACRLRGHNADGAIVCEPMDLQTNIATMGVMWFRVTVVGSGAHVFKAHQAVNAIEKCFPLVAALRQLEEQMNAKVTHRLYRDLEHPINLNVGQMEGGHWPSSVPAMAKFVCRISYTPGVSPFDVRRQIEACIAEVASADPWLREVQPTVSYYGLRSDGSEVDTRVPLVETLGKCHRRVLGEEMQFDVSTSCHDGRYFNNYFGTSAVAYGPIGGHMHGVDEYVELESIVTGAKVLASFLLEWCGVAARNDHQAS
jgi:acetylornithine deacetylase